VATTRRSTRAAKAPGLNRDYSDVDFREDEIYDGEQPTKGMYRLRLVAVADHTKQNEDEPSSVKWTFQIMDGEKNKHGDDVAGWRGYKYTNENAAWVEQKILVALGLIKPKGKISLPYAEMVKRAKPCRGLIALERYIPEDGDPEWRASLTSVFMPDGVSAKAKSKAAEADEEDEDEDDEPPATSTRSRRRKQDPEPEPEDEDESDDEEDDEEEVDLDELAEELEALSLAELKKRAREEYGVKITRGMDADAIIDAVLETLEGDEEDEEEDDEEDEEPEPEPAKRPARSSTRGKTGSVSSRGRSKSDKGYDDEPPF
jgi:hypothetical protein